MPLYLAPKVPCKACRILEQKYMRMKASQQNLIVRLFKKMKTITLRPSIWLCAFIELKLERCRRRKKNGYEVIPCLKNKEL